MTPLTMSAEREAQILRWDDSSQDTGIRPLFAEIYALRAKLAAAEAERDRLARLLNPPTQGGQYPTPENV